VRTRKVAILTADGCDDADLDLLLRTLTAAGAQVKVVAPHLGYLRTMEGKNVKIHCSLLTTSSVLFDAVYVPGGDPSVTLLNRDPSALEFIYEAYKHAKAIGASGSAIQLFQAAGVFNGSKTADEAVVVAEKGSSEEVMSRFVAAIEKHRNWEREKMLRVDLQPPAEPTRKSA
jgi:catalase